MTDTDTFNEGDRVVHKGEKVKGTILDIESWFPQFKVEWDDGVETLENLHTVIHLEEYSDC